MKCPACGANNRANATDCINCGDPFDTGPLAQGKAVASVAPRDTAGDKKRTVSTRLRAVSAQEQPVHTPSPIISEEPAEEPAKEYAGRVCEPSPPPSARRPDTARGAALRRIEDDATKQIDSPGLEVLPELEAVAIKPEAVGAPRDEAVEITRLHERRLIDQGRFEDLAGGQRPWSFMGVSTRMVGRAAELDALHDAWRTVLKSRRMVAILITGSPGIGKTRLVDDFAMHLRLSGRSFSHLPTSVPEGAADLRSAILEPLQSDRFDLDPGSSPAQTKARLRHELGRSFKPADAAELTFLLGYLLGLGHVEGQDPRLQIGGESLESRAQRVLVRFLSQQAREAPLLWVIDELERSQDETMQAFFGLCQQLAQVPILLLGLASHELRTQYLPWGDKKDLSGKLALQRIDLGPLSAPETRRLLESFLGRRDLPEPLVSLAHRKSGGNPLALEQVLELFQVHGVIARTEKEWNVDPASLVDGKIPVSLENLVEARIQQLDSRERRVLRQAAVQGSTFWLGSIMACTRLTRPSGADAFWFDERLEEQVRKVLLGLQGREFIKFLGEGPFPGELQFEFRQSFEREWIYQHCPETERALYHRMFAQWVERISTAAGRPMHGTVARHLEAGGAMHRAALAYVESARLSAAAYRNHEAIVFLRRAVKYLAQDAAAIRLEAFGELGRIHYAVGAYQEALDAYQHMLRDTYILGSRKSTAAAYIDLGRVYTDQGSFGPGEKCLTRALRIYEEIEELPGIADALDRLGQLFIRQGGSGSLDQAQVNFERSLKIRQELTDEVGTALSYHLLGWVYLARGFTREGRLCFSEAIRLRTRVGDKDGVCRSMNNLAETYRVAGEFSKARRYYNEALPLAKEIGARPLESVIVGNLAECDIGEGKLDGAREHIEQALAISTSLDDRPLRACHLVIYSKLQQKMGDRVGALSSAEDALRLLERLKGTEDLGPALRRLGEILADATEPQRGSQQVARARECFRRSIRILSDAGSDVELAASMEAYARFLIANGFPEKGSRYRERAREIGARMERPER